MNAPRLLFTLCAASVLTSSVLAQDVASTFRRFSTKDNRTFRARIIQKSPTMVTLKLENGRTEVRSLTELSEPDQLFVRKWTKFKDELLRNAEFAQITVKGLLDLRDYQSFEFDIAGNHIYVEGEVNGKPMRFMIDTGADSSLFHVDAAKEAGCEVGPLDQKVYGIGGEAPAAVTKVQSLKIGDAVITTRTLLSADLFRVTGGGEKPFDAIFGADFLRELDAVISYREGRMFLKPAQAGSEPGKTVAAKAEFRRWTLADGKTFTAALHDRSDEKQKALFRFQNGRIEPLDYSRLSESDLDVVKKWSRLRDELAESPEFRTLTVKELLELRGYESFVFRLSGNHILVDGQVKHKKATFLIDTGAHDCLLHLAFTQDAGLKMGPMDRKVYGIGGEAPAALTEVPLLKIGDSVIEGREVLTCDLFKDLPIAGEKGDHDAILGANFLRELDAVISYKEGRMFLKPDNSDRPAGGSEKAGDPKEEADTPSEKEP